MATVNLGRIKPVFRGAYAGGTAYVVDDIVTHGNESFICIQAGTGNATSNASYWTKLAAKGSDGTDVGTTLTTQGDILYRDGSGLQRLAAGTSGHFLKTQGTGANPVWAESGGKIVNIAFYENTTEYSNSNNSSYVTATNHSITYTPSATNNILYINFMPNVRWTSGASDCNFTYRIVRTPQGGSDTTFYEDTTAVGNYWYDSSGGNRLQQMMNFLHRDNSHNTTSQLTYRVDFKNDHSSRTIYMSNSSVPSRWLITEVKP